MALHANPFGGPTPLLERLRIEYANPFHSRSCLKLHDRRPLAFHYLPKIQELLLINVAIPLDLALSPNAALPITVSKINPTCITRLSLHLFDIFQRELLLYCTNVVELRVGDIKTYGGLHAKTLPTNPPIFPRLRRLELGARLPDWFWKSITFPVLDVVVFETWHAFYSVTHAALPPFVTRVELRWPYYHSDTLVWSLALRNMALSPLLGTILCPRRCSSEFQETLQAFRGQGGVQWPFKTLLTVPEYYDTDPDHVEVVQM
jgi:hypothetical protein